DRTGAARRARGDVDDAPPVADAHAGKYGLRAQESRLEVDGEGAVEVGLGQVVDAAADGDAGVVDENVYGSQLAGYGSNELPHLWALRDVGTDGDGPASELAHRGCDRLGVADPLAVVHRHVGAGLRKRQGNGFADAAR